MNHRHIRTGAGALVMALALALALALAGCIKNDLPYPRIEQNIRALAAEGESKAAYIDSVTMKATVYLAETTDIYNVRFTEFRMTPDGHCNVDLLDGTYDLSSSMYVTLSLYQDYDWEISAEQEIERYFQVDGEVGESVVDPVAHRVVVHVPMGTDLTGLTLASVKLGPEGLTTYSPGLKPGPLDLSYPLRVEVTAWGRTEIWTIYAEEVDAIVTTSGVDAWSQVIWAYGIGPADVLNGFEYRMQGDADWTDVPEEYVSRTQGSFSCYIPHLEPMTGYEVRAVSGENRGNTVTVTTQSTADIPNGDFEDWSKDVDKSGMWNPWPIGGPQFWDTGNPGSITLGQNVTEPSEHTPTGTGTSAMLQTRFVGFMGMGKLGAGSMYTGKFVRVDGTNGVLAFGQPWTLRPTRLRGFFQYKGVSIDYASDDYAYLKGRPDTCHIYVALTDWTAPYEIRTNPRNRQLFNPSSPSVIAYGELVCGDVMNSFRPFEILLDYRDTGREPTYLQITFSASKYGDYFTGGSGSTLWIDQLSFDWDY